MNLHHTNCGGEIQTDWDHPYETCDDNGHFSWVPGLICTKCKKEILGDPDIMESFEDIATGSKTT